MAPPLTATAVTAAAAVKGWTTGSVVSCARRLPVASIWSVPRRLATKAFDCQRYAAVDPPPAAEPVTKPTTPRPEFYPRASPASAMARHVSTLGPSKAPPRYPSEALCFVYKEHGEPLEVLHPVLVPLPQLQLDSVVIQFLASPVNPSDLNMVEGSYPQQPEAVAVTSQGTVAGSEGVAQVVYASPGVAPELLKPGDWVIPRLPGFGTWRTYACVPGKTLQKLPDKGRLTVPQAATIAINPCTAYRLLKDFVSLRPGDCVIQNGANSSVGQAVIQLARSWGLRTVNVIRRPSAQDEEEHVRPSFEETSEYLKSLGANHIIAQDELLNPEVKELFRTLEDPPKLGLNCIGGKPASDMARYLMPKGTLVTYGAMSRQPTPIPASLLIFRDLTLRGFWLSRWVTQHNASSDEPRHHMLHELVNLARTGSLREPRWEPHYVNRTGTPGHLGAEKESAEGPVFTDEALMGIQRSFRKAVAKSGIGGTKHLLMFHPGAV